MMSKPSNSDSSYNHSASRPVEAKASEADRRRDETITRIRTALLNDRLAVMDLSGENTGTDPYNSGVHRVLARPEVWNKRSR